MEGTVHSVCRAFPEYCQSIFFFILERDLTVSIPDQNLTFYFLKRISELL